MDADERLLGRDLLECSCGGPSMGGFGGRTGRTRRGLWGGPQAAAVAEVKGGRVAGRERLDGSLLDKVAQVLANCVGLSGSSRSFLLSRFRHTWFDARREEWVARHCTQEAAGNRDRVSTRGENRPKTAGRRKADVERNWRSSGRLVGTRTPDLHRVKVAL